MRLNLTSIHNRKTQEEIELLAYSSNLIYGAPVNSKTLKGETHSFVVFSHRWKFYNNYLLGYMALLTKKILTAYIIANTITNIAIK